MKTVERRFMFPLASRGFKAHFAQRKPRNHGEAVCQCGFPDRGSRREHVDWFDLGFGLGLQLSSSICTYIPFSVCIPMTCAYRMSYYIIYKHIHMYVCLIWSVCMNTSTVHMGSRSLGLDQSGNVTSFPDDWWQDVVISTIGQQRQILVLIILFILHRNRCQSRLLW